MLGFTTTVFIFISIVNLKLAASIFFSLSAILTILIFQKRIKSEIERLLTSLIFSFSILAPLLNIAFVFFIFIQKDTFNNNMISFSPYQLSNINNTESLVIIFIMFVIFYFINIQKAAKLSAVIDNHAARLALDSLPTKQLTVDSLLSNKIIDETTARQMREKIRIEADYYGIIHNANRFLFNSLKVYILITVVCVLGHFIIFTMANNINNIILLIFILAMYLIFCILHIQKATQQSNDISSNVAHFILDSLPAIQMNIDLLLNSGKIDETTAQQFRKKIRNEVDYCSRLDYVDKFLFRSLLLCIIITILSIIIYIVFYITTNDISESELVQKTRTFIMNISLFIHIPFILISSAIIKRLTYQDKTYDFGGKIDS